jgi:hypothetical protein
MGNRATVVLWNGEREPARQRFSPAVYLHWNGGPESVYAFLAELDRREVRADQEYEAARLVQLVGEFFDQDEQGGLSLGVVNGPASDAPEDLDKLQTDHGDNGLYLVDRTGETPKVRRFTEKRIDEGDEYKYTFVEWDEDAVAAEHRVALQSDYREQFASFYLGLSKKKTAVAA